MTERELVDNILRPYFRYRYGQWDRIHNLLVSKEAFDAANARQLTPEPAAVIYARKYIFVGSWYGDTTFWLNESLSGFDFIARPEGIDCA